MSRKYKHHVTWTQLDIECCRDLAAEPEGQKQMAVIIEWVYGNMGGAKEIPFIYVQHFTCVL